MVPGSDYPVVRAARARQEFRRAGTWSRVSDCWDGADEDVTWSGGQGIWRHGVGLGEGRPERFGRGAVEKAFLEHLDGTTGAVAIYDAQKPERT